MDELRDKYLQDQLTEEERIAFEERLSKEEKEELANELGIRDEIRIKFRQSLREEVAGFEQQATRIRQFNPTFMGIAATLLLISSLIFYFAKDQGSLFDQYYEVYPNYELTTVRGEGGSSDREKAYQAYDSKNYEQAITSFNSLDTLLVADRFFRGLSYLENQEPEMALKDFDFVLLNKDKNYSSAAVWYSALINIHLGQNDKAVPLLRELSSGKSEFADDAKKLLNEL